MYSVKMAFVLIQVGTNLWVNPMQLQGVEATGGSQCKVVILVSGQSGSICSDWSLEQVRKALTPDAVSRAIGGK